MVQIMENSRNISLDFWLRYGWTKSPGVHSWLRRANQIRYEPIRQILPNVLLKCLTSLIPVTWASVASTPRFLEVITPLAPIFSHHYLHYGLISLHI